jgi:hypothetical protein
MSLEMSPTDARDHDSSESPVPLDRLDPARRADDRDARACPVHLPTGQQREPVGLGSERYQLRGSDVETLVAVEPTGVSSRAISPTTTTQRIVRPTCDRYSRKA